MIIFTSKWSVPPVSPTPTPKLNSHFGLKFRSVTAKILLLLLQRIESRDRTHRAVVFEARIDNFRHIVANLDVRRECHSLRDRGPMK